MHYAQVVQDPKDREEVAYMFSRPVLKLKKELEKIKTRSGEPVKVRLCYFPTGPNGLKTQVEPYRSLWKSVADQAGVSFADLTEPFLALRPDYFPVAEYAELPIPRPADTCSRPCYFPIGLSGKMDPL